MFSFFRRKKPGAPTEPAPPAVEKTPDQPDTPQVEAEPSVSADVAAETATTPGQRSQDSAVSPEQQGSDAPAAPPPAPPLPEPSPSAGLADAASGVEDTAPDTAPPASEPLAGEPELGTTETSAPEMAAPPPQSAAEAAPGKGSWLSRLKQGLARTGQSLGGIFVGVKVDEDLFEELETALIMADAGVEATEKLLTVLRARVKKERITDAQQVKSALCEILSDHLQPLEKTFPLESAKPLVVMIAGVNGAGKTTSIGKLAHAFQAQGASVLLAAADTFRAAAREQLMEWGARNNVSVIAQEGGDPAAIAFDAVNAGRAREASVVMVDTAGRLPTQLHLMEELKKIKRVVGKADGSAPHEILLVVDGNTGQNAISQVKAFDAALGLTGLVVTKLDGTAKGGALAAMAAGSHGVRPIPVYWIGVGEGMHDLQPFVAREFATALLGD